MNVYEYVVDQPVGSIIIRSNEYLFTHKYYTQRVFYKLTDYYNYIANIIYNNKDSDNILVIVIDESYYFKEEIRCSIKIINLNDKHIMLLNKKSDGELVNESTTKDFIVMGTYLQYSITDIENPKELPFVRLVSANSKDNVEELLNQHFEEMSGDHEWQKLKVITEISEKIS
jgi:hypothetical protein